MGKKNGPLDWLKKIFEMQKEKAGESSKSINNKLTYVIILVLVGVALMLISDLWKNSHKNESTAVFQEEAVDEEETFSQKKNGKTSEMKIFEEQYENELKEALDQIVGVFDVTVIVNVEATEKKVFEKNSSFKNQTTVEEDKEGGTRKIEDQSTEDQLVLIREGDKDVPLILETRKPEIKGVLVVAGGAENIQVKKWIIEAVTRMLDVPSHKVAVMPKKSKGDS